jgi:cytochrome c2
MDWLRTQEPRPLVDPTEIESDADWERLGQRVSDELDQPKFRTSDPPTVNAMTDREILKTSPVTVSPDGQILGYHWDVEARGKVSLSVAPCTACHTRLQPDGSLLRGPPRNTAVDRIAFPIMAAQVFKSDATGQPLSSREKGYVEYVVPWLKDDIHARFLSMTEPEYAVIVRIQNPGTANRFNGSPFYVTKIPDLIGIKDRRYLDATATHRNRGPEDIARYTALVASADDGSIGPHRFLSDKQRRLTFHYSDTALYALGRYIYALEPPPNANPFDDRARRGETIFHDEGCAKCHSPPAYTNNKLIPVEGFVVPDDQPDREHIMSRSIDTDPSLALRTRKGTGFYKVPSLRGVWYRGTFEHSGSVTTLEDWFDPKRLEPDYVPKG